MSKKAKTPWLTECQIGDQIWDQWTSPSSNPIYACDDKGLYLREFNIGNGRVDFAVFNPKVIDLYELKITASVDSVIQIAKYQRDLNEYLRLTFYSGKISHEKCPKVALNLMARYFDYKIIELCAEFNITRWLVEVHEDGSVSVDLEDELDFPDAPDHFDSKLKILNYYQELGG